MPEEGGDKEKLVVQLKAALRRAVDDKGYQRMMNVMVVNQNLFGTASQKILELSHRVQRPLTEKEVLQILSMLRDKPKNGGISIIRK